MLKIEKWKYKDKEVEVPIFEDDEIEKNDDDFLENTVPIETINEDSHE